MSSFLLTEVPPLGILIVLLAIASYRDWKDFTIPDWVVAAIAMLGVARMTLREPNMAVAIAIGMATALTALLWLGSEIYWRRSGTEALGLGDVKLIGALALWFGPLGIWSVLFGASVCGIVFALMQRTLTAPRHYVPFGPFLGIAAATQALIEMWSLI